MVKKLLVILLIASASMQAQDIHFTQWMFSPLNLNPGETGRFDGDYRIVGNYRSQWASIMDKQYRTFGLSVDKVFKLYDQELSAGLTFANDRASIGNLMQNKLQLSTGYSRVIKGHYFTIGAQFGLLHKSIDPNAYTYPVQWDNNTGGFSNTGGLSNMENFTQTNDYMFDFNAGIGWGKQLSEKIYSEVGIAFYHINTPEESFLGDNNDLTLRHVYNWRVNYKINDKFVFAPNVLYMYQIKGQDLVFGGIVKMKMEPNKAKIGTVFFGSNYRDGFYRNFDAMNLVVGAKREEWQVGLSYDFNVSTLSAVTNYRGAFEVSVIYIPKSSEPSIFIVPCDL